MEHSETRMIGGRKVVLLYVNTGVIWWTTDERGNAKADAHGPYCTLASALRAERKSRPKRSAD